MKNYTKLELKFTTGSVVNRQSNMLTYYHLVIMLEQFKINPEI